MQCVWGEFLELAKQEIGTQGVEAWLKCVTLESYDRNLGEVSLVAPNDFITNWVNRNYCKMIKIGFSRLLQVSNINIKIKSFSNPAQSQNLSPEISLPIKKWDRPVSSANIVPAKIDKFSPKSSDSNSSSSKYQSDSFVVGPHNHLAYSAGMAIARGYSSGCNPLFIYGKTGLGKTHLLHCVWEEAKRTRPTAKIIYKPSDRFVDEFICAIKIDKMNQFKEKYSKVDILLIDDIQFLSKKEQTQEIFFHIFNNMYENGKKIILSSDMPPSRIIGFQDRLRSRFSCGLTADIQAPSFETRVAILDKKAHEIGISFERNLIELIASKQALNIRQMEGLLIKLHALSLMSNSSVSRRMIETELEIILQERPTPVEISPIELVKSVARHFDISLDKIKSNSRDKNLLVARQVAMYFMRNKMSLSLREIGDFFGGKSHSTVINSIESIEKKMKSDSSFEEKISGLGNSVK